MTDLAAGASLAPLLRELAADSDWIPNLAREITEAIDDELPELDVDEFLREATYASTESVLRLFVDIVRNEIDPKGTEPPAAAVEWARELVRRGISVEALLRAFHIGQSAFFQRWVEKVQTTVDDPAERVRAIDAGGRLSFDIVQTLTGGLAQRYEAERERWVRSAAAIRLEIVQAILVGEELDLETAGRRLGYRLNREHLAFVVWRDAEPSGDVGALERSAAELAEAYGGTATLIVPFQSHLVAGWVAVNAAGEAPAVEFLLPAGLSGDACAAVGSGGPGIDGFRRSHREAMNAYRVARQIGAAPGAVTAYRDVALAAVASADLDHAHDFVARELGALARDDEATAKLAETLRVYLEERSSPRRTAQRLGVHENTVVNRIRAARDLVDGPVEERVTEVLVALRLLPLVRGSGHWPNAT